jgi:histidinol-phosphate aminotransferase
MESYTPIEPTEILEQRTGGRIIKLDGNENSYGCSPKVYQALADYSYYHIYPDPEQKKLRQALEEYTHLSHEHIVCGAGSDELIDLILRLFLKPEDEVINCSPTFGMYPFSTEVCGGKVVDIPRSEDFAVDIVGIRRALNKKTKVIFIASPNNPTGNTITGQEILELVDTGKIVVVDEAYFEFSNITMAKLVPVYPNLIVLRTFSKWAGLAGLRIGYGIFPIEIATYLMKIKQPYNINSAAQAAVLASLSDIDYLRDNVAKIVAERQRLFAKLSVIASKAKQSHWLKPYPSQANFILCSVIKGEAREIWQQLQRKGIFVRYFDSPRLKDYLRISVGKPEDTDALIEALKELC